MVDDRVEAAPEAVEVAAPGRLVEVEELRLRARVLLRVLLLLLALGRKEVRRGRDVRVRAVERNAGADDDHDRGQRPPFAPRDREHDQSGHESGQRGARDREHEPGEGEHRQRDRASPQRCDEERDDQHVGSSERADIGLQG